MNMSPKVASARARVAGTIRNNPGADVTDLRRELRFATAEDYIARIVGGSPALTDDQLADLAGRLLPAPREGADAA